MSSFTNVKSLVDLKVDEFLRKLGSDSPAPGGGSAAALAGAMAASLVAMVGSLTRSKVGFESVAEQMDILVEQGHSLSNVLEAAIDRDAQAFDQVMAAYRLPKASDEERAQRSLAIQEAMTHAAEVPLEVAQESLAIADLAIAAVEKGNPNAVTDAAAGVLLALSGAEIAVMNVVVNLSSLKDKDHVAAQREECTRLLRHAEELRVQIKQQMRERLPELPSW